MDINNLEPDELRQLIDQKISLAFTACRIAFLKIDNVYLLDLISTLISVNPKKLENYKPPTRQRLAGSLLKSTHAILDKDKKKYLDGTDSILLVDGWKNKPKNRKYLVHTLRNINIDNCFLTFQDISTETEHGTNLADNIDRAIRYAFEHYKTNVVGISTDNDAKIKLGAEMARNVFDEELLQVTCMSHSANCLIKEMVDEVFAEQLRTIVKAFSDPKMNTFVTDKYGGVNMENYPDTRFNFLRETCIGIHKNLSRQVLQRMVGDEDIEVSAPIEELIFDDDFRRKLTSTIKTLTPICKLLNTCQDPKTNIADGTELWLKLKLDRDDYDELIQKRITTAVSPVAFAANLLHPKYKGANMDEDQITLAKNELRRLLNEDGKIELEDFFNNRHRRDVFAEGCTDPLSYWAFKSFKYSNLSLLCKRLFLLPASTSQIEGYFSMWTYIHDKYRNALKNETSALLADAYHICKHVDENGVWINTTGKRRKKHEEIEDDLVYDEQIC